MELALFMALCKNRIWGILIKELKKNKSGLAGWF